MTYQDQRAQFGLHGDDHLAASPPRPQDLVKTRLTAYALWLLLGWFGIHRFYLRQWKTGFAMLGAGLLTGIMTSLLGPYLGLPMAIWWIVDAFLIPGWIKACNAENATKATTAETV